MENTLATLVNGLNSGSVGGSAFQSPPSLPPFMSEFGSERARRMQAPGFQSTSPTAEAPSISRPDSAQGPTIRSWAFAVRMAETFLLYCESQPLPLFHPDSFVATFPNSSLDVVFAVLAAVFRFSDVADLSTWKDALPNPADCKREAHRLAMGRIANGRIELATLQTLCLLAITELNDGDIVQCRVHSTLAMTLARSAELDHERLFPGQDEHAVEERRRCYWSIVLLHHIIGDHPANAFSSFTRPQFPASSVSPPPAALTPAARTMVTSVMQTDEHGISSVVIQLSEVWCMAQSYIRSRGGQAGNGSCDYGVIHRTRRKVPPWHSTSKYSATMELVMELGDNLPPAHRYRNINLPRVDSGELRRARGYWAPWILSRLLYHTTLCILNHPILIILQIQGNRDVSEVFLQQTTFSRAHHSAWVLHFINFVVSREFVVSDPVFGYCAAVLASIELHQSFVETDECTREKRKANYEYCVRFIRGLGNRWVFFAHAATKLERLMQSQSTLHLSSMANGKHSSVPIDISGFFEILDITNFYSSGSGTSAFGQSLQYRPGEFESAVASSTRLAQPPPITEIDHTQPQSSDGGSNVVDDSARIHSFQPINHIDSGSRCSPSRPGHLPNGSEGEADAMYLQSDQLFGPLYETMGPWDLFATPGSPTAAL
ncbi:hypothetical protein BDW69DRAFT_97618 [Aspergillus filifer]